MGSHADRQQLSKSDGIDRAFGAADSIPSLDDDVCAVLRMTPPAVRRDAVAHFSHDVSIAGQLKNPFAKKLDGVYASAPDWVVDDALDLRLAPRDRYNFRR